MKFLSTVLLSLGTACVSFVDSAVPTEAPTDEHSSEYPISEEPFYSTSTFDPKLQGNCDRAAFDTHGYVVWELNKAFGKENCSDNGSMRIECSLNFEGAFSAQALYDYKENPVAEFTNPVTAELKVFESIFNSEGDFLFGGSVFVDFFEECIDSAMPNLDNIERRREEIEEKNKTKKPTKSPTKSPTNAPTTKASKKFKSSKSSKSSK